MSSDLQITKSVFTGTWDILRILYVFDAPVYNYCITATIAVVKLHLPWCLWWRNRLIFPVLFHYWRQNGKSLRKKKEEKRKHSSSRFSVCPPRHAAGSILFYIIKHININMITWEIISTGAWYMASLAVFYVPFVSSFFCSRRTLQHVCSLWLRIFSRCSHLLKWFNW